MTTKLIRVIDMTKLKKISKPENYKEFAKRPRKSGLGYHNVYLYNKDFETWLVLKKIPYSIYTPERLGRLYTELEYND